jgi:hypothetical protein
LGRMMSRHRAIARRASWGVADQTLSSLTNFTLAIMVAHESAPRTFGLFALIFATFSIALGACRAVCCEPLTVRFSSASPSDWSTGARMATGTAIAIGTVAGIACAITGLAIGGQASRMLLILGLSLPGLLLQDAWRYVFFTAGKGAQAFVNDALFTIVLLPTIAILIAGGHVSVETLLAVWGGAAAAAAILGVFQAKLRPSPLRSAAWWRLQSDLAPRYLAEFVGLAGEAQVMLYGIAAVTSLDAVAAVRGGLLLLGPINILGFGALLAGVPEAVRSLQRGPKRLIAISATVSVGLAGVTLLWASLILLLPSRFWMSAVGPVWHTARPLILPLALGLAALGVVMGAVISLRALAAARRSLRARLLVSPVILITGMTGAALAGASGAAWGLVLGNTFAAIVFWYHLIHATSEHGITQQSAANGRAPRMMLPSAATQPS